MSFRPIQLVCAAACAALLGACGGSLNEGAEADDMTNVPFTREVALDTSLVVISQSVNSCDWGSVMQASKAVRTAHGIELKEVYKGLLDSNLVVSLSDVSDLDKAKDYVSSDQFMHALQQVSEDQTFTALFLDQQLEYTEETKDTLVFYMSFKTLNYKRWEQAFLDDYRDNPSHEFEVIRVFVGIENPDHVHMLFKVNDPNYVQKMEKNNAFRMKMLAAGVVSYPVTYKLLPAKG
ncbi:MAG: hypothetical protein RLP15_02640 [Cryomorphaceae bacterium]